MFKLLFFGVALSCFATTSVKASSDTSLIRRHLTVLTKTPSFRTHQNLHQLNQTAEYIHKTFSAYSPKGYFQDFEVAGKTYRNVISSFGPADAPRIVIGAHYDVCGNQEGADDNARGVTGLLELARLLQNAKLKYRVDLVAYSLEEPPYFKTENMGSYVHARSLCDESAQVLGMISLEMIGYFKDEKHSQSYPAGILSLLYGTTGDYITLVKKFGAGSFARKFSKRFKSAGNIKTKTFTGPKVLPGIDFSDHLNYWLFGYSALMITDTAFYRNLNYHESTDTMDTLDLFRMGKVIDTVFESILSM